MVPAFLLELRLPIFLSLLVLLTAAELVWPRRKQLSKLLRFKQNLSLQMFALASLGLWRLLLPLSLVAWASWVEQQGWGLINTSGLNSAAQASSWAYIPLVLVVMVLLDCGIYWQHRLMHKVPFLWRLHLVHHSDTELDVSSALRFHPLEILLSYWYKMLLVLLLGAPAAAVYGFEVLLSSAALFNHSNIAISEKWDKVLRRFWVTPDMHRIHHSLKYTEQQANFATSLSCWDTLFASYQAQSQAGQLAMGLGDRQECQQAQRYAWWWLLVLPFKRLRPGASDKQES